MPRDDERSRLASSVAAADAATGQASHDRASWMLGVLRRAMARVCPRELAGVREDLVHSALLRMLEREREAGEVHSASYLWKVAYTVAIGELRRVRRHPTSLVDVDVAVAARSDLAAQLDQCLSRLPEPRRLAVALHLQGFTSAEAALALGWNEKRVRNLVFRGLEDLRRCLSGKVKR